MISKHIPGVFKTQLLLTKFGLNCFPTEYRSLLLSNLQDKGPAYCFKVGILSIFAQESYSKLHLTPISLKKWFVLNNPKLFRLFAFPLFSECLQPGIAHTIWYTSLSLLCCALYSCVGALFGARLVVCPFCLCTRSFADVDVAYITVLANE